MAKQKNIDNGGNTMKTKVSIIIAGLVLLFAGSAGATNSDQLLLDGTLIPKFADPLPVGVPDGTPGGITVVNATHLLYWGFLPAPTTIFTSWNSSRRFCPARAFRRPGDPGLFWSTGQHRVVGLGLPDGCRQSRVNAGGVRPSYLGPVVVAQRRLPAHPTYLNELPYGRWEMFR